MKLFDTHAHLNDPDLFKNQAQILDDANQAGVYRMMAIGIDLKSSHQCLEIAIQNDNVFASVGVHPNHSHLANDFHWQEIKELARSPQVVALGETGLDCYWDDCPLEIQKNWFVKHIEHSHETGLPIVVHQRESEQEILDTFAKHNNNGSIHGIMHSFTGSWETARICLDYGLYISFAGMLTFKNAQDIRDVASKVPADRILIETDSPYLTPHPHRGKRPNHPAMVAHTAICLAEARNTDVKTIAAQTTENANRIFGIKD